MIGEVLKKTRLIYGFTAIEMSNKLGISASFISEIEKGKKQPSLELLQKYADVYRIKLSSLILLSENYENILTKEGGAGLVQYMMMNLINFSYNHTDKGESEENNAQEV